MMDGHNLNNPIHEEIRLLVDQQIRTLRHGRNRHMGIA